MRDDDKWEIVTDPDAIVKEGWQWKHGTRGWTKAQCHGDRVCSYRVGLYRRPKPRSDVIDLNPVLIEATSLMQQLTEMIRDRDRWLARCRVLEARLEKIEAALDPRNDR